MNPCIAIIGAGNMGSSLIGGLIKNGHPADKLLVTDPSPDKLNLITTRFQVRGLTNNLEAAELADVLILAVKPQIMAQVTKPLHAIIQQRQPLILSVAAGIRIANIAQAVGDHIAIIRTMPNTPALIGAGATALFANHYTTPEQRNLAESIMRAVGITVWVDSEQQIDAVTALSGSGPAYFFLVLEAMQASGEAMGLSAETAQMLAQQTALGAAMMAIESTHTPAQLRQQVTSPGGTTERAISVLEEHQLRDIFKKALFAAKQRSEELANLLGETP